MANYPSLLEADEPTGNLDLHTADELFALFLDMVDQTKTMLPGRHDIHLSRRIPRVVEMVDGQIVRDGAPL